MTIKKQAKNDSKNHRLMNGKPFFGIWRVHNRYSHRHLYDNYHKLIKTNLHGTDFAYGAGKTSIQLRKRRIIV